MFERPAVRFPQGFLWGAVKEDGRGPSIWDTQCHHTDLVADGHSGDVATDHYHRWSDDVDLMDRLGLQAYRFSVGWPRIQPTGAGAVNQAGLDFYSRLVDRLRERGIVPMVTLYHWDLPQGLQDAGGWPGRDAAHRFAEYAAITSIHVVSEDPDGTAADAARRYDALRNRVWTEPMLLGRYPPDALADLEAFGGLPIEAGDLAVVAQPLDWLGLNYYDDDFVRAQPGGSWAATPGMHDAVLVAPGDEHTDMGWPITPDGLRALLLQLQATFPALPPIYITENGCAFDDPLVDGVCHDPRRIAYLDAHLRALHAAISAGVDVRGYLHWSLLDDFEWSHGYHKRFGLVHVDDDTQVRTPRDSAGWYRGVIARNGLQARAGS